MSDYILPSDQDAPSASAEAPSGGVPAQAPVAPYVLPSDADAPPAPRGANPGGSTLGTVAEAPFVGANSFLADALGAPADAWNWARGKLGWGSSDNPLGGSRMIKQGLGLIGANPDDHRPNSDLERYLQAAGGGAASMILPEGVLGAGAKTVGAVAPRALEVARGMFGSAESLPAVAANAGVGSAASLGATAGEDLAPERYKPAAALAGSLVGGGLPALGAAGIGAATRKGVSAGRDYVRPMTAEGQKDIAADALRGATHDPSAAVDAIENAKPLVPGSAPTTFQVTGDMGLGSLEWTEQQRFPHLYQQRRADQNAARLDALGSIQPTGDPADLSGFFNRQLAGIDGLAGTIENAARARAQNAAAALPGTDSPEAIGSALRGNLADAREIAKGRERALWDAVDPDNTLAIGMGPVKARAKDIWGDLAQADAANLGASETTYRDLAAGFAPVVPFREMQALRSNLASAMREELRNGKTPAYGRMSRLMDAVQGAINNTIEGRAVQEAHAVARGAMAPEDTIAARLAQDQDEFRAFQPVEARSAVGAPDGGDAAARTTPVSGIPGAEVPGSGGPRNAPGGPGLPQDAGRGSPAAAPPEDLTPPARLDDAPFHDPSAMPRAPQRPDVPRPQHLESFIRELGGVQDPGGDLASMGLHRLIAKPGKGLGPDAMRQVAAEAGYLHGAVGGGTSDATRFTTIQDLHDALEDGARRFSVHDEDALHAWDSYDDAKAAWDRQRAESDGRRSSAAGPRPKAPLSSYSADDIYGAGQAPVPANGPLPVANFDAAAAGRLKAASAATRERAETFDQGTVGGALRSQGTAGNYRMLDAKVPGALFKPGPEGKQVADAYFKAAGREPEALSDFVDAAALSLRKAAVKDGLLDPAQFDAWRAKHGDALRAVPEAERGFASAAEATRTYAGLAAARRDAVDAFQAGAISKVMGQNDPVKGVAAILGRPDAVAQMRNLAARASADPVATQGLRKAVADLMVSRLVSNTEAATSERNLLKSDAFQTFVRQSRAALAPVFSREELGLMHAIADDLHRANRSITAVKLPGQSNTAQSLTALAAKEPGPKVSLGTKLFAAFGAGFASGNPVAMVGGPASVIGQHVLGGMREAGMRKAGDLVRDAMLNPDLAKALLLRAPIRPGVGSEVTLRHQLSRLAVFSAATAVTAR